MAHLAVVGGRSEHDSGLAGRGLGNAGVGGLCGGRLAVNGGAGIHGHGAAHGAYRGGKALIGVVGLPGGAVQAVLDDGAIDVRLDKAAHGAALEGVAVGRRDGQGDRRLVASHGHGSRGITVGQGDGGLVGVGLGSVAAVGHGERAVIQRGAVVGCTRAVDAHARRAGGVALGHGHSLGLRRAIGRHHKAQRSRVNRDGRHNGTRPLIQVDIVL